MKTFTTAKGTELPIMDLHGKDYLLVAHRLRWFREEKPLWTILTEFIHLDDKSAVVRATIKDESGRVVQTGHRYEDKQGFQDFREKAESSAVGRALGMLGYGTQFAPDLEEGERIVDSPLPTKPKAQKPLPPITGASKQELVQCCGDSMMLSKYDPNTLYCPRCKRKQKLEDLP